MKQISEFKNRSRHKTRSAVGKLLILSLLTGLVGCGDGRPTRVPVSGKVTIDGKPLKVGSVKFFPAEGGRQAGAGLSEEGRYSVVMYEKNDGLPVGEYNVTITSTEPVSDTKIRWLIPKRFSERKTSKLKIEISEETDSLDFDLSWEKSESKHKSPWVESF